MRYRCVIEWRVMIDAPNKKTACRKAAATLAERMQHDDYGGVICAIHQPPETGLHLGQTVLARTAPPGVRRRRGSKTYRGIVTEIAYRLGGAALVRFDNTSDGFPRFRSFHPSQLTPLKDEA